jgi:hypothetical protein
MRKLPLTEASRIEMQRRKRVSLIDAKNAASLAALDRSFTPKFLRGLCLPDAVRLEHKRRNHVTLWASFRAGTLLPKIDPATLGGLSLDRASQLQMSTVRLQANLSQH